MKKDNARISVSNISHSQVTVVGRDLYQDTQGDISGQDKKSTGASPEEVAQLFFMIFRQIDSARFLSSQQKTKINTSVREIQAEAQKGQKANKNFIVQRLRNIKRMAPDIGDVIIATLINPSLGLTEAVKKVATKIKTE